MDLTDVGLKNLGSRRCISGLRGSREYNIMDKVTISLDVINPALWIYQLWIWLT